MPVVLDTASEPQRFAARIVADATPGDDGFVRFSWALLFSLGLCEALLVRAGSPFACGFIAFDAAALWLAFFLRRRRPRPPELLTLADGEVTVERDGEETQRLRVFGLALECEQDPDFGCLGLWLRLRERRVEIARALSPHERAEFAEHLHHALRSAGGLGKLTPRPPLPPLREVAQAASRA